MNIIVECRRVRETDNAVLIVADDNDEEVWIPFSQVSSMHFDGRGNGHVVMTRWIAEQKGLA